MREVHSLRASGRDRQGPGWTQRVISLTVILLWELQTRLQPWGLHSPDTRIRIFDVLYHALRVGSSPILDQHGLQLGRVCLRASIGWRENWFAGNGNNRGNGWVAEGEADDLGADEPGGTSHYELHSGGLNLPSISLSWLQSLKCPPFLPLCGKY